ncbi:hypothetical protein OPT61_g7181 [Boeremia exigua]|uniref:Uncharacterized protein n=1 Tax=Boeremia exigua TaxID=749465 RepID=A0ACC2I3N2_9PLEO|nr:hypothetical protein OPT61_g7181 [Boeremia exigua]
MTSSTLVNTTPSSNPGATIPAPTASLIKLAISDSNDETIVFGTLGLVVAVAGIVVAVLQLRRMRRRHRAVAVRVYELA